MKKKRILMAKGNRKLPKTTFIWNLPAITTCPNSTPECRKYCYAKKAERIYKQVLPFRQKNYELSLQLIKFNNEMIKFLRNTKFNTIRLHESGDFYSQKYFNNWCLLSQYFCSDKIVYAYTKVHSLNLSIKPKNMIVILSDDDKKFTIKQLKEKGFNGRARVVEKGYKAKGKEFICTTSCKECDYCYTKPKEFKQVIFIKH